MLKKIEFLPREHLVRKYLEITGQSQTDVDQIVDQEGIETVADMVEEYLIQQQFRETVYRH
jgi:hypothetical protein